jgi:hypothetical protein
MSRQLKAVARHPGVIVIAAGCLAAIIALVRVSDSGAPRTQGSSVSNPIRALASSETLPRTVLREISTDPHQPGPFRPRIDRVRPAGQVFGMDWFIAPGLDSGKVCLIGVSDGSDSRTPSAMFRCSLPDAGAVLEYGVTGPRDVAVGVAPSGVTGGRYRGDTVAVDHGLFALFRDCGGVVELRGAGHTVRVSLLSPNVQCSGMAGT